MPGQAGASVQRPVGWVGSTDIEAVTILNLSAMEPSVLGITAKSLFAISRLVEVIVIFIVK